MTGLESFLNRKTTHNTMYVRIIVIIADEWMSGKRCLLLYLLITTAGPLSLDRT